MLPRQAGRQDSRTQPDDSDEDRESSINRAAAAPDAWHARIEAGAKLAKRQDRRGRMTRPTCWKRSYGRAIGFAWRATTRSRRICSAPRFSPSISPRCNDLHMVQSGVVLPEHLDLFERGVAKKLDYAYSGPQSARIATMLFGGKIELGAVHTYLELFARYFIDLTPTRRADRGGAARTATETFTPGPNTEDTPTVVEATAFKDGIVIAQVNEIVDKVPRVDIPGDRVHFVVKVGQAVLRRAAVHARSGRHHRGADPDRHAGDQGHLCALWHPAAQPRHRFQHCRDRASAADIRREARTEGQDRQRTSP